MKRNPKWCISLHVVDVTPPMSARECAILPDDTAQPSGDIKKSDKRPYEQKSVATEGQKVLEFLFLKFRLEEEHF